MEREGYSVVSEMEDIFVSGPHFGLQQRQGGSSLSSSSQESLLVGTLHRMVSGLQGDFSSLQYLGATYSRPFYHSAEQQGRDVPFSPPRPLSSCPLFFTRWFRRRLKSSRFYHGSPEVGGFPWTQAGQVGVPQPSGTTPSHLQTFKRSLCRRGFWERLGPSYVQLIDCWCTIYTMPCGSPFVTLGHSERRILFTLISERCWATFSICGVEALNTPLFLAIYPSLDHALTRLVEFRHPLMAKWVLGNRSQNPTRWSLILRWDLSAVLVALTEEPFEPLCYAMPKNLTLKALFHLATASLVGFLRSMHFASIPLYIFRTNGLSSGTECSVPV